MNTVLVEIEATDHLLLPGLLFEPKKPTNRAAIFLHGNGSSSILRYQGRTKEMVDGLNAVGISYLALNNRGAGYINKFDVHGSESVRGGMAYEVLAECVHDINGSVAFLKERGYDEIYLIGFSTGANKICVYNHLQPKNTIAKYVLGCGADDVGLYYTTWGEERYTVMLNAAKRAVTEGKGAELIPELVLEDLIMTWQALYDTLNPEGDYNIFPFNEVLTGTRLSKKKLFKEFSEITKPSLAIYGENDQYSFGDPLACVEILKKHALPNVQFATIPEADHGFTDKGNELAATIVTFLNG